MYGIKFSSYEIAWRFGIIVSRKSRHVTQHRYKTFTFISQFRWDILLATVKLLQQINASSTIAKPDQAAVRRGSRRATLFHARWCVHAALRTLSHYLTDARRRELCIRRKSARPPAALVPSGQVVSHRRYSRRVCW
jgi:hypothetical protein